MILALGILMSLSGAGLAVSGLGESGDASTAQYFDNPGNPSDSSSSSRLSDTSDSANVQPAAQESSGSGDSGNGKELPFTGFAAIPVLIGGLGLLCSGFVLRRRSARE